MGCLERFQYDLRAQERVLKAHKVGKDCAQIASVLFPFALQLFWLSWVSHFLLFSSFSCFSPQHIFMPENGICDQCMRPNYYSTNEAFRCQCMRKLTRLRSTSIYVAAIGVALEQQGIESSNVRGRSDLLKMCQAFDMNSGFIESRRIRNERKLIASKKKKMLIPVYRACACKEAGLVLCVCACVGLLALMRNH